jgi:integrase
MSSDLVAQRDTDLAVILSDVGQAANEAAAATAFADYRARKAANTLTRQDNGLTLFSGYLAEVAGVAPTGEDLTGDPLAWRGVTWGLVDGFTRWLLLRGYAASTANVHLSTIKTYAGLAAKAGALSLQDAALIRSVQGYSRTEAKRVDEKRKAADIPTRRGAKKAQAVGLTPEQAKALRSHPDTPQGRRDALLMTLLLDLGLRVGELAALTVDCVDLQAGELRFYRQKVDIVQTHRLTPDALQAARAYLAQDAPPIGPLLRASRKSKTGDNLTHGGMTARAITQRVRQLGERTGIEGLSAHDCRHFWATQAARNGTPIDRLQDAGGWASPAMPLRYVESAKVANEGLRLGELQSDDYRPQRASGIMRE